MSLLSIHDDHEYFGEWTLPGSGKTASGQLRCSRDRAELNVNDAFTPLRGTISVSDAAQIYPVVHGVSSKSEALTLLKAQSLGVGLNLRSGGMRQSERLVSSWVIVGAHVSPDTLYSSVRFFIPALEVWLSRPIISQSIEPPSGGTTFTNTFVVRPPEAESTPASHIEANLEWGSGVTVSANPFTSIDVKVRGWVVIRPKSPRTLEWFLDQQDKLATLLAFMAGAPMPIDAIQASMEQSTTPLAVFVSMRQVAPCEFKNLHDFFIPRGVLGNAFPRIVDLWFREVETVLTSSKLALAVISTNNLWLHVEFLSLIQALEGFHRGRFSGNYMSESEYDSVKSIISSAIPPSVASDHRDALRSRIRYGNQISLSKRLNELKDCVGVPLANLIIASDGKIPRSWIDTRNYLSHWDTDLQKNALDGQEMYNANVRMEHLLRVLYLLMAGVSLETIVQCLQNASRTSQQLIQLNIIARKTADPSAPSGVLMTIGGPSSAPNTPNENPSPQTEPGAIDEQAG
jgi:hypothetical protein